MALLFILKVRRSSSHCCAPLWKSPDRATSFQCFRSHFFLNEINRLIFRMLHRSSMHHVPKKCGPSNQCCAILWVCFMCVLMLTRLSAVAIICILLRMFALSPLKFYDSSLRKTLKFGEGKGCNLFVMSVSLRIS